MKEVTNDVFCVTDISFFCLYMSLPVFLSLSLSLSFSPNCSLFSLCLSQTPCKGSVVPTHVPAMGLGPPFPPLLPAPSPCLPPAFFSSAVSHLNTLDTFCELGHDPSLSVRPLDSLDPFPQASNQGSVPQRPPVVVGGEGLDSLSEFTLPGECVYRCNAHLDTKRPRLLHTALTHRDHAPSPIQTQSSHPFTHSDTEGTPIHSYRQRPRLLYSAVTHRDHAPFAQHRHRGHISFTQH